MTIIKLLRALGLGWLTWALTPGWLMRDAATALALMVVTFIAVAVILIRRRTRQTVRLNFSTLGWSR